MLTAVAACNRGREDVRGPAAEDLARQHAVWAVDGPVVQSEALRYRIAGDTMIVGWYAGLLAGHRRAPFAWDTARLLWWLAENRDPRHVPLFLRFAAAERNEHVFRFAVYGLARTAARSRAARERLRQMATTLDREEAASLAVVLLYVNDAPARDVLTQFPRDRLPATLQAARARLLRTPALPRGPGRFPCLEGEVFGRDREGVYRCVGRSP